MSSGWGKFIGIVNLYIVLKLISLQALQYNVPGGKKYRGMIAVQVYETIAPKDQLTEENLKLASLLGWLVEFVSISTSTINM